MSEFPTQAQVVIIGGGVGGSSIAYHLTKLGWKDVVVLERHGNWYRVQCSEGTCLAPLWGAPQPAGWVYGGYIRLRGACP